MNYLITKKGLEELRREGIACKRVFYSNAPDVYVNLEASADNCSDAYEEFMRKYEELVKKLKKRFEDRPELKKIRICNARSSKVEGFWRISGDLIAILNSS